MTLRPTQPEDAAAVVCRFPFRTRTCLEVSRRMGLGPISNPSPTGWLNEASRETHCGSRWSRIERSPGGYGDDAQLRTRSTVESNLVIFGMWSRPKGTSANTEATYLLLRHAF